MGRPNLPTADKIQRGNPGKRALNRQEPDPDYLDDLTPPAWLPEPAKAVWLDFAPKLRKAKVLTVIDVPAFEKWCVKTAQWRAAIVELGKRGVMVERVGREGERSLTNAKTDKSAKGKKQKPGAYVINQLVFAESMFFKQALSIEREFGMTPAARTRVQIEPQLTLFPDDAPGTDGRDPKKEGAAYFTGATAH
jgi:P27 family predicted phage terminase small subunit